MRNINVADIVKIRTQFMKQNKIPLKIYFPVSKYNLTDVWTSPSAAPGRIYGIELRETLDDGEIRVIYKSQEGFVYV